MEVTQRTRGGETARTSSCALSGDDNSGANSIAWIRQFVIHCNGNRLFVYHLSRRRSCYSVLNSTKASDRFKLGSCFYAAALDTRTATSAKMVDLTTILSLQHGQTDRRITGIQLMPTESESWISILLFRMMRCQFRAI